MIQFIIFDHKSSPVHKDSGIKNNPNDWIAEVGNPRYILDLVLRIVNVSMQPVDIMGELPKLDFE